MQSPKAEKGIDELNELTSSGIVFEKAIKILYEEGRWSFGLVSSLDFEKLERIRDSNPENSELYKAAIGAMFLKKEPVYFWLSWLSKYCLNYFDYQNKPPISMVKRKIFRTLPFYQAQECIELYGELTKLHIISYEKGYFNSNPREINNLRKEMLDLIDKMILPEDYPLVKKQEEEILSCSISQRMPKDEVESLKSLSIIFEKHFDKVR